MEKTIRELIKMLEIKEYDISFWRSHDHEVGVLPCELIKTDMALNPVNMTYQAWQYDLSKKRYVIYVNAYDNIHYIAFMYKLIGEHIQFQMENRD